MKRSLDAAAATLSQLLRQVQSWFGSLAHRSADLFLRIRAIKLDANLLAIAFIGTTLAVTFNDLLQPANRIMDVKDAIVRWFQSEGTKRVNRLYENEANSNIWVDTPSLSEESKEFLIDHWEDIHLDRVHQFDRALSDRVELDRMLHDLALDGRWVQIFGYVSQVLSTDEDEEDPDLVDQVVRLSVAPDDAVAWCRTTRPRDRELQLEQPVAAHGVVYGRGASQASGGGFVSGTLLVCPGVKTFADADTAQAVNDFFNRESGSPFWQDPPSLAGRRLFYMRNWEDLDPTKVHGLSAEDQGRLVALDRLWEDDTLDGKRIAVDAYITDVRNDRAPGNQVRQFFELEVGGQDTSAWCYSTFRRKRAVEPGNLVRVYGAIVARGSAPLTGGGFTNGSVLLCPRLHRWQN
jgi:hypothetical protein